MNRQEKIKLLEGIASGKIPVQDLQDSSVSLWFNRKPGIYEGEGSVLTEREFVEYKKKYPRKTYLTFKPAVVAD